VVRRGFVGVSSWPVAASSVYYLILAFAVAGFQPQVFQRHRQHKEFIASPNAGDFLPPVVAHAWGPNRPVSYIPPPPSAARWTTSWRWCQFHDGKQIGQVVTQDVMMTLMVSSRAHALNVSAWRAPGS
jgi:hypothetical protein